MDIHLNFRSRVPIYIQIIEQIRTQIAAGSLQPGDQLPTVRQLAQDLRVNFNTIARAYRLLDEEGVISTQHGRGTYILEPETHANGERLRAQALESLTVNFISDARSLGYEPEIVEAVFRKHWERWRDLGEIETESLEE